MLALALRLQRNRFRASLAGIVADEFASYGFDTYHHYETRVLQRHINWKLAVDTFLESYHIGVLHREGVAILLVEQNVPLALEASERVYIMEKGVVRHQCAASEIKVDDPAIRQYLGV